MNREAVGLGSWLLRDALQGAVSLDTPSPLLDWRSFALWQAEQSEAIDPMHAALLALLREIWRDELTPEERAVLRCLYLEGKNEAAAARAGPAPLRGGEAAPPRGGKAERGPGLRDALPDADGTVDH